LGILGLVGLFALTLRLGTRATIIPLVVAALIIVADNYAVQAPRCFFLIFAFLSVLSGRAALDGFRRRIRPIRLQQA
jgi:hypothetical protein